MANTASRGYTFGSTELVTNAKLHALADSATIVVDTFTGILPIANGGTASATQNFVSNNGTVNPVNLLSNGGFESWLAGTSVAPDGWGLVGASATVARSATKKIGTYSAELTRVGADCYLSQAVEDSTYLNGRTVTFGCWVYSATASVARLSIGSNEYTRAYSSYHTGNSTWQWLTVTSTWGVTGPSARCWVDTTNASALFDGAMLVEGASYFSFSPKPLHAATQIVVEVDETKFSHKLPVVINGTTYYIMMTAT